MQDRLFPWETYGYDPSMTIPVSAYTFEPHVGASHSTGAETSEWSFEPFVYQQRSGLDPEFAAELCRALARDGFPDNLDERTVSSPACSQGTVKEVPNTDASMYDC